MCFDMFLGRGIVTLDDIHKGEYVLYYSGKYKTTKEDWDECDDYVFEIQCGVKTVWLVCFLLVY